MPYDLQDIQDRINTLVNNDNDTPTDGDDEWNTRLNLIYQAISEWELMDVDWDELWTSFTVISPVTANDRDYSLSTLTNMRRPGGWLKLTLNDVSSHVELISPEESQKFEGQNARVAWFTGNNKVGWTLNLGWNPEDNDGTVGATMSFPYYKYATLPTLTTDEIEVSDPNFVIYRVASVKSAMEGKNNLYSIYSTEALNCMDRMKTMNFINPQYQNNTIEDVDSISFDAVIGE